MLFTVGEIEADSGLRMPMQVEYGCRLIVGK